MSLPEVPRRLSGLLAEAREADPRVARLVALRALHSYSPEIGAAVRQGDDRTLLAVDDGTPLEDEEFGGADLVLTTARIEREEEEGAA